MLELSTTLRCVAFRCGRHTMLASVAAVMMLLLGCDKKDDASGSDAPVSMEGDQIYTPEALVGVWRTDRVAADGRSMVGLVTFRRDGAMMLNGVIRNGINSTEFKELGTWAFEDTILTTVITNSTMRQITSPKTSKTKILSLTESNYVYQSDDGTRHTVMKQERQGR